MSNLFIQVENGAPIKHPASEDNIFQAYGEIPSSWEPFIRVERPDLVYEVFTSQTATYQKISGVWTDVWAVRAMTSKEKGVKQQQIRDYEFPEGEDARFSKYKAAQAALLLNDART